MNVESKSSVAIPVALTRAYERAQDALGKQNFGYAFQILRGILLAEPAFDEARLTLRQAQLERIHFKVSICRQAMAMCTTAWAVWVKGPLLLSKGNTAKALDVAEGAMQVDPTVVPTLQFLRKAASAAGLTAVAVNAMEIAVRFYPKNKTVVRNLAELYQEIGDGVKAVQMWQKLLALMPNSLDIENELKHATALAAMQEAKWEGAGSYRELIRDKDQAEVLEQQERISTRDVEGRTRLIAASLKALEERPSAGQYRKLAELYHQNGDFDLAVDAYNKITELTGNLDPGIDSAITEVLRDRYDKQIADLKSQGEAEGADSEALQEQITAAAAERDDVMLERYRRRVENYPNELQFRFELGLLYWQHQRVDEALSEFQQAQRNSHLSARAQVYMGKCLKAKKLFDLAVEQLVTALTDTERLSAAERKDALYELAEAYEAKKDVTNALATLKQLFNIDVNYCDVAQRLETHYARQGGDETA